MEEAKKITGGITISKEAVMEIEGQVKDIFGFKKKIESSLQKNTTELWEIILTSAIALDCSDIHIEPEENRTKLRVRIDGVLQDIFYFDSQIRQSLISRVKLLSGLKLNVLDRPQDGRFSILLGDLPVEIRVSSLPSEYGETIVLRILNPKKLIELEKMGLRKDLLETFLRQIEKPNGMIIVTGPTGSGKSSTLYAFLKKINNPEIKVITIEDPIEYHLEGISQTQVDPARGYDFSSGLRSIMRQDPDAVLVGEIRDLETASIALQAALTGHLVFSTLHTNDAAGTIPRLQALGEKPANIAPAINMAIAQRLARRVCPKCVKMEKPSPEEFIEIKKALQGLPENIKIPKISPAMKIPKAKGCAYCNSTGYKGRIAIFEALINDNEIEKSILTSPAASVLNAMAIKKGMVPMRQDGFIKILEGITTIEEIDKETTEQ
jgi:type II secretory ATPase GspE/PulE/Tfp pilus assembly ATPase PilB-like protein